MHSVSDIRSEYLSKQVKLRELPHQTNKFVCTVACWRILDYCDWLEYNKIPSWYKGESITKDFLLAEARLWKDRINSLINGA